MRHELRVVPDGASLAAAGAEIVTRVAAEAVAARGAFHIAFSGGRTPWAMVELLAAERAFPWDKTVVYQVDERVVRPSDPDRNLAHIRGCVPPSLRSLEPMPVDDADLEAACARYATRLPDAFDLIHLGLGADGHTASLVPGDTALDVTDQLVALTAGPYVGHRRMTMTFPALNRARALLWLVAGADKEGALSQLLAGDRSIPAARVVAPASTIIADAAAAPRRPVD